jgi:hypothetical protein
MAAKKRNPQTVVLDHSQAGEIDVLDTLEYIGQAARIDFADDTDTSLCSSCGEPLAWHDEACVPSQIKPDTVGEEPTPPTDTTQELTPAPFAYTIGQPVQPDPDAPARPVIWRGQLKARHPRTGLIHRVNVYRLDNDYWDCYYEAELQAAWNLSDTYTVRKP